MIDYSKKLKIGNFPSEIQRLEHLEKDIGSECPQIYFKRDDETGLAFGGNKVRKLEYIMYDAMEKNADVIITSGGLQTNHGRLTVAAANKFGMKPVLVLTGEEPEKYSGNLLANKLLGAELHFAYSPNFDSDKMNQNEANRLAGESKVKELVKSYEKEGKNVYVVPRGGRSVHGTLGYTSAVKEVLKQEKELDISFDYVVTSVGSTSTLGGLIIGKNLYNLKADVIGISVSRKAEEIKDLVKDQIDSFSNYFHENIIVSEESFELYDEYVGEGYAIPTEIGWKAIKRLASLESIFTDPVYTGKGASGLIDLIENGRFKKDDKILFIHTGGAPALFSFY